MIDAHWPGRAARRLVVALLTLFALPALSGAALAEPSKADSQTELVVLNWSDYMDPDIIKEFEKKFGVKVKQIYYESDELRDEMLVATNGTGYDVIVGNALATYTYKQLHWIAPLTPKDVPNIKYINPKVMAMQPWAEGMAVPYFWGTVGIAYRKDKVTWPVTSWMDLFRPKEALRGKIVMINSSDDTIGMALKALGASANSTDSTQLAEVEKLLLAQKPYVREYSYLSLTKESAMVTGEVWMAMLYNGDALMLREFHPDITYIVPKEGGNLWVDYLMVASTSKSQALAHKFINFLNEPKIAARQAQYVYYATPNKAAERFLPKDYFNDPIIYPPKAVVDASEFYDILPARAKKRRNALYSRITK